MSWQIITEPFARFCAGFYEYKYEQEIVPIFEEDKEKKKWQPSLLPVSTQHNGSWNCKFVTFYLEQMQLHKEGPYFFSLNHISFPWN